MLAVLEDPGNAQARTIAKTLGKDFSNTHKRLSSLRAEGRIKKEVIEGKTFFYLPEK